MDSSKLIKIVLTTAFSRGGGDKLSCSNGFSHAAICFCRYIARYSDFVFRIFDYFKKRIVLKKCVAFTLAETLIVMGIIGVVAALTIPNVNKNTGEAEKVARLKKIYAELNEAFDRATAVYGPIQTWVDDIPQNMSNFDKANARVYDRVTEFLKVTKSCRDEDNNCMPSSTKNLFGYNTGSYYNKFSAILSNGTSIRLYLSCWPVKDIGRGCSAITDSDGNKEDYGGIYIDIDIDGPNKGKNTWGMDLFELRYLRDRGIHIFNLNDAAINSLIYDQCFFHTDEFHNEFCSEWVLRTGNMDYLNADSEGKCNNDKTKILGFGEGYVQSCK